MRIDMLEWPGKVLGALVAIGGLFLLIPKGIKKLHALYNAILAGVEIPGRLDRLERQIDKWGKKLERGILNQILTRRLLLDRESSSAFCEFDAKGKCLWASRLFRKTTGLDSEEAKGNGWMQGIHGSEVESLSAAWQAAIREARGFERTVTLTDREGNTCIMRLFVSPLLHEETGELLSWFSHCIK